MSYFGFWLLLVKLSDSRKFDESEFFGHSMKERSHDVSRRSTGASRKNKEKKCGTEAISIPKPCRQSQTCYFLVRGTPTSDRWGGPDWSRLDFNPSYRVHAAVQSPLRLIRETIINAIC